MSILNQSVDELVDFIEPQIVIDDDREVDWAPNTDRVMDFNNEILAHMETAADHLGIDTSVAPCEGDTAIQSISKDITIPKLESRLRDSLTAAQGKGDWDQVKKVAAVLAQAEKALSKMREAINTINRGLFKSIADRQ